MRAATIVLALIGAITAGAMFGEAMARHDAAVEQGMQE